MSIDLEALLAQELGNSDALPVGVAVDNMMGNYDPESMDMAQDADGETYSWRVGEGGSHGLVPEMADMGDMGDEGEGIDPELLAALQQGDMGGEGEGMDQMSDEDLQEMLGLVDQMPPEMQETFAELAQGIADGTVSEEDLMDLMTQMQMMSGQQDSEDEPRGLHDIYGSMDEDEDMTNSHDRRFASPEDRLDEAEVDALEYEDEHNENDYESDDEDEYEDEESDDDEDEDE